MNYIFETLLIALVAYLFMLFLPWWTIAIAAGLVSFIYNTSTHSFLTGFIGVALLWFFWSMMNSMANEHLLAEKMAHVIVPNGALGAIGLVLVTAMIGGLVGGLGAMTGKLGRRLLS